MKLNRLKLVDACKAVIAGCAEKEVIAQSSSFIFEKDRIFSFNDEVAVSYPFETGFEGAVPAKEFLQLISKVKAEEISLTVKEGELLLVGSKAKAGLRLDKDIKLSFDDIEMSDEWIKLPESFCKAISFCLFSASKEQSKAILQNIHVIGNYAESCDNYRITRYNMGKTKAFPESLLIPAVAAKDIISNAPTEYSVSDGWLHFKNESDVIFSCRTVDAEFPDFTPFLNCVGEEIVFPKTLPDILDRASVLSDGERITVILEKDSLTATTESVSGWFEESADVEYDGDDVEFDIQPEFMKTIMKFDGKATVGEKILLFENETFVHAVQLLIKK